MMASGWILLTISAWLLSALAIGMTTGQSNNTNLFVTNTVHGKVRGKIVTTDSGDVIQFLGIPYAKPPTGMLRFQRPFPPDPWTVDRDAFTFSPICTQLAFGQQNISGSEDCLYLNVYIPANADISKEPLSVMFWIHGGGYYCGAGSQYDGSGLANHGVVVVTINYRLGAFGFLSTEDDVLPGNLGMMDQIMALEWVQQNIAAFGGDPKKVTIFGESAGASSASLLLLSPLAKGLFQRAIMESGSSLAPWAITHPATSIKPRQVSLFIGNSVGCADRDSASLLSCLRNIDHEVLLKASILVEGIIGSNNLVMKPRVETTYGFLPDLPVNLLASGRFHQVNTIRGFNAQETGYAFSQPQFKTMTLENFKDAILGNLTTFLLGSLKSFAIPDKDQFVKDAMQVYKIDSTSDPGFIRDQTIQATSNLGFVGPAMNEIKFFSSRTNPIQTTGPLHYLYRFDYRLIQAKLPPWIKNTHGEELYFVLNTDILESDEDHNVSDFMMEAWTNFAKSGDPNNPTNSGWFVNRSWTPFRTSVDSILSIDSVPRMGLYAMPEVTSLSLKLIRKIDTSLDLGDWIVG